MPTRAMRMRMRKLTNETCNARLLLLVTSRRRANAVTPAIAAMPANTAMPGNATMPTNTAIPANIIMPANTSMPMFLTG